MRKHDEEVVSAEETVNTIEAIGGKHNGFRRAHAKGIAFDAEFISTGAASPLTTATYLQKETVSQAIVRFSHSSPQPEPNEAFVPIKGMAVCIQSADQSETNLTMANIPVFITQTPDSFVRLLQVATEEPLSMIDKLKALKHSPEYHTLPEVIKSLAPPKSFASERYFGIHAFYLVNQQTERQAVRFEWEPLEFPNAEKENSTFDHLEDELLARMEKGHVRFRLILQLAHDEDPVDDPTVIWPEERVKISAGVLTLTSRREDGADFHIFDPTIVPDGIECSDDPVLHFRSAAYAESAKRRSHEKQMEKEQ